jgi:WD40 repeat protein
MGLFGNAGTANQVVFSADGTLIAAAFSNGLVKIWRGRNATSIQVLDGRCGSMEAVAFSTDGQILASGSIEGRILLWDVATGQIIQDLEAHGHSAVSMSFSGYGRQLASSFINGTLRVWVTNMDYEPQVVEVGRIMRHLSFDPKARHCLYTDTGCLEISPSGEASFPGYSLSADNCWILKDGKRVLLIPSNYSPDSPGRPVMRGSMLTLVDDFDQPLMLRFA